MAFTCISCRRETDPSGPSCPYCGEVFTDFLRTYMVQMIDGKYQIIERLGRGGMGEVYKVLHTHLGVTRVIKTMRPRLTEDPNLHERFAREAKLATRIQHPNVAMLYDFSSLPDGSFYMVWEYIEGTNLATIIRRRGKLEPKLAIDISVQALHGLQAIHAAGIIHRDISPENIMVSMDSPGVLRVKVIDLGIAKSETVDDALTSTGMFVGKWKYASPEQMGLLPEGQVLDGRADLFSFGIVLYEMLAGRAPYEATTPGQYLMLQIKAPNPVTVQNLTFPDAPGLEKILERAIEKERDKRYPTAQALADELAALRATLPASADEATIIRPGAAGGTAAGQVSTVRTATPGPTPLPRPSTASHDIASPAPVPTPSTGVAAQPPIARTTAIDVSTATARVDGPSPTAPPAPPVVPARAAAPAAAQPGRSRTLLLAGGIGLVALLAIGAALVFRFTSNQPNAVETPVAPAAATATAEPTPPAVSAPTSTSPSPAAVAAEVPASVATPNPATSPRASTTVPSPVTAPAAPPAGTAPVTPTPAPSAAAVRPPDTTTPAKSAVPAAIPVKPAVPATEPGAKAAPAVAAPPVAKAETVPPSVPEPARDDKIATAGPLGRRSHALTASDEWKEFPRGIIQNYEDLYSGAGVDWAAVARGVKLSQYKVVLDKVQNRTKYDASKIGAALGADLQKQLDEKAGDKGTVTAQIALVWAAEGDANDVAFEVIFRDQRGPVVAKFHHRLSARSPEGLADDVAEAIRDFIADHPVVK